MIIQTLLVSLKVTITAVIMSFITGTALARIMTKHNFKLKGFCEMLLILPMFLPPSVVGYILLLIVGRRGVIGAALYKWSSMSITFTWWAAAIAAFSVSIPLMYQGAKGAFLSIDSIYEEAAKVMGASDFIIFWKITMPMAIKGILSSTVITFGRAFGEFGATLMVAGNIPGKTQTIPVAMFYSVEGGDISSANVLLIIILVIGFGLIAIQNYLIKNKYAY
jgi:molybdate transport system permease protein